MRGQSKIVDLQREIDAIRAKQPLGDKTIQCPHCEHRFVNQQPDDSTYCPKCKGTIFLHYVSEPETCHS